MKKILFIKNMVCNRCIKRVKEISDQLEIGALEVRLGEVEVKEMPDGHKTDKLRQALSQDGFELIDDKKSKTIQRIKTLLINEIHHNKKSRPEHQNFSDFLQQNLGMDYSYLSSLFSAVEGTTIEKYIIAQKVEKVKELLVYDELSINEIAWHLEYSSVQHLSTQFKKITGLSPSHYKKIKENKRRSIDEV